MAARLLDAIADRHYFNGSVDYDTPLFNSRLVASLVIRRTSPGGAIESIVPVWWSHRVERLGESSESDFSWS
ncbi:MAG: hypothetical protein LBH06_07315 [Rikenellaceae bacterium]|jgi:hypothetical protein|nr:hypothetical protein [Rikenellaceae bacterium]